MSIAAVYQGRPLSSILLFAIDDDFTLYFATHTDSFKSKALMENPLVSLSVWSQGEMLVQADGNAQVVKDAATCDQILVKLSNSAVGIENFWPPVLRIRDSSGYTVFQIKLHWLRVLDLHSDTITAKELPFTEIAV